MFRPPHHLLLLPLLRTQRPLLTPHIPPSLTRTIVTKSTPLRPSFSFLPTGLVPATPGVAAGPALGMMQSLMAKISSNPGLLGVQVRCGPRNTFNPSHRVRKRRLGFLARKRTPGGRGVLKRRRAKGRKSLTH